MLERTLVVVLLNSPVPYVPELLTPIGRTSKSTLLHDYNMGWSKYFFSSYFSEIGYKHDEFSQLDSDDYCSDTFQLAMETRNFVCSYALDGRNTITRNLNWYFKFVTEKGLDIRSVESIERYCLHLNTLVKSTMISSPTASGRLSTVNIYLMHLGAISRQYQYSFKNNASGRGLGKDDYYKPNELGLIIHICSRLWKLYDDVINTVADKIKRGLLPKNYLGVQQNTPTPIKLTIDDEEYNYEVLAGNFITTYMVLSHIMFTYYTLSRKSISTDLKIDQIIRSANGSIDTSPSLKGRGFKFVRFGIGKSSVDIDKSGLKMFEEFLQTREKIVQNLKHNFSDYNLKYEHFDYVFFSFEHKLRATGSLVTKTIWGTAFRPAHIWKLTEQNIVIPKLNLPILIKSAEMLLEDESQDPALLVEKSQHEWSSYEQYYGRGNPLTNLREMSEALNIIASGVEVQYSLEERQRIAKGQGIQLIDEITPNISISAHGLGCDRSMPKTNVEKAYLYKMNKRNFEPKQCADLTMCLACGKCAIVEDPDCLYELLSFRQAILLNKGVYRGAKVAESEYEAIIKQLNEALELVDVVKLSIAQEKINKEGMSDIWKIKV